MIYHSAFKILNKIEYRIKCIFKFHLNQSYRKSVIEWSIKIHLFQSLKFKIVFLKCPIDLIFHSLLKPKVTFIPVQLVNENYEPWQNFILNPNIMSSIHTGTRYFVKTKRIDYRHVHWVSFYRCAMQWISLVCFARLYSWNAELFAEWQKNFKIRKFEIRSSLMRPNFGIAVFL